jgi:hypothetical protein
MAPRSVQNHHAALHSPALTLEHTFVPPAHDAFLALALLRRPVELAGLDAQGPLRLEAGMRLTVWQRLDEGTHPIEAVLS